ncbi:MAG: outer membrane lipoprotein carrier protein LolA [Polyangiaceae bacterium]|nr:outer membrane lipoprotein carrier protein LolA [Polyangiaceae bacterium]
MERRSFILAALAFSAAVTFHLPAQADDVGDTFAEIKKAREKLKTLVATFTQERTIGLLSSTVKSEGEMTLVRPDKLRWELKSPDAVTYWITPDGFAFSTANGSANVSKTAAKKFGDVLSDLLIFMGGDLDQLKARYEFSVPSKKDGVVLKAVPKTEEVKKVVKSLELSVAADLWTVKKIVIEEKSGDKSVITFTKVTKDVKVDDAKMKPPK